MDEFNHDHYVTPRTSGLSSHHFEEKPTMFQRYGPYVILSVIFLSLIAAYIWG